MIHRLKETKMPVLNKSEHARLWLELNRRFKHLADMFEDRELSSNSEGLRKGSWVFPKSKCATLGGAPELRMSIEDFKTVLAEIKRLK